MIRCDPKTGRWCHVLKVVLENPLPGVTPRGILGWVDGHDNPKVPTEIVYAMKVKVKGLGTWTEYVMPYCPWCGVRLRPAVRKRAEE